MLTCSICQFILYAISDKRRIDLRQYLATKLSESISKTPEGYLLCVGVPVAKLGEMRYTAAETGDGELISVNTPEVLFSAETAASFEGKPVTVQHPDPASEFFDVTPENWKAVAVGTMGNARAGTGDDSEHLLADILITDAAAIELVLNGLREVSLGYDAEHGEKDSNNRAIRKRIIGNHVALVDRGRAGSTVAIRDSKPEEKMADKKTLGAWFKSLKKTIDEMPADEVIEEAVEDEDPMADLVARIDALEARIAALESDDEAEDVAEEVTDEAVEVVEDAEPEVSLADAEIIASGVKDGKGLAMRALKMADSAIVASIVDDVDSLKGDALKAVFNGVVALQKAMRMRDVKAEMQPSVSKTPVTPESLNEKYAQFWAEKRGN